MHMLPVLLATLIGVATAGPLSSPGIKERIFNVGANGQPNTPGIREPGLRELLLSSDISTRNSALEDLLLGVLEDLRKLMVTGSDDVPVLDPFHLDELHLNLDELDLPVTNSHVTLKDMTVSNLSTFEVDQLSVSLVNIILQRYRVNLDGRIPVLDVTTGNYDLLVNIFGGTVFGNGNMKAKVINPRVNGFLVVGLRLSISGVYVTVHDCRLNFNLEALEADVTGLFGDEAASEFVSSFISSLIPEFVEYFQDDISDILSTGVRDVANDILKDLDLASLLP